MNTTAITKQQQVISSLFKKGKKSLSATQSTYGDFANFLTGADKKLKKSPLPKRSELDKFKTKEFVSGKSGGGGGLLGGIGAALSGIAAFAGGKGVAKGINTIAGKRIGQEVAKEGTEKLGQVASRRLGKETVELASKEVGKKTIEKGASKMLAKKVPIIGAVLGTAFGIERAMRGDFLGAAGELASGVASTIPGAGTAVSLGIDAALIAKDVKDESKGIPGQTDQKSNPTVQDPRLQGQTIAQQSDIKTKQRLGMDVGTSTSGSNMINLKLFSSVVEKFGKLSKQGILGQGESLHDEGSEEHDEGGNSTDPGATDPYTGPISGDQFFPLPGGVLSNRSNGYPGGEYGAPRNYGGHSGQDIGGKDAGSPVVAWKTGKISYSGSVEAGDTILQIDHGNGIKSVYKHVVPTVPAGTVVYGGQQIATLFNARAYAPHLHFEVWQNGSHTNPNGHLGSSQKIPSPLDPQKAKEQHEKTATQVNGTGGATPPGEYTGAAAQKSTVIGDSIAQGMAEAMGASKKYSKQGADVGEVRQFAEMAAAEGQISGKNVVLSSGISNDTSQMAKVKELISYLKGQGAAGVQLMGTSVDRNDLSKMNPQLAALAKEFPGFVQFTGGFNASDKIHPNYANQVKVLQKMKRDALRLQQSLRLNSSTQQVTPQQAAANIFLNNQQPAPPTPTYVSSGGGGGALTVPAATGALSPTELLLIRLNNQ